MVEEISQANMGNKIDFHMAVHGVCLHMGTGDLKRMLLLYTMRTCQLRNAQCSWKGWMFTSHNSPYSGPGG